MFFSNHEEDQYLDLLERILKNGCQEMDRTGVGTKSVFGPQMQFDVSFNSFPLLTTKKVFFRGVVEELIWILSGDTNAKTLEAKNIKIWSNWQDEDGDLGPIYGYLWRSYPGPDGEIDQISELVQTLKTNPSSRRNLVVAVHPSCKPKKSPQGCHSLFQLYCRNNELSLQHDVRSTF